jgi:tRNA pseudouridine32 synthase
VTTVNGKIAKPDTKIQNGDRIEFVVFTLPLQSFPCVLKPRSRNVVHRHEPPVTAKPVKIIHHDVEREFVVIDKPGSIVGPSLIVYPVLNLALQPVHAAGRYFRHTLVEILKTEFGYEKIYSTYSRLPAPLMLSSVSISCEPLG